MPQADEEKRLGHEEDTELHFMENKRFDFVDLTISHLQSHFPEHTWTYFYPPTSVNYAADLAEIDGELIPLQHLLGGPLSFRLESKDSNGGKSEFVIFSPQPFSNSDLSRLIGLANGCSHGWAHQVTIVFPELTPSDKTNALEIVSGVKSRTFAESIGVQSFESRTRLK